MMFLVLARQETAVRSLVRPRRVTVAPKVGGVLG